MRKNKFFKKIFVGFALSVFLGGIVSVCATTYFPSSSATYDNNDSGLSATNVQDAIDELYLVCKPNMAGNQILDEVDLVESGAGLYEDEYEEGRYIYKGKNPNNYITFNDETAGWRIISLENDGTIKIIKNSPVGSGMFWGGANVTWEEASLQTYLTSGYYINNLNPLAQLQAEMHDFYIGTIDENSNDLEDQLNDEKSEIWRGRIGLINASDYIRASANISKCSTISLNNNNHKTCYSTNWLYLADTNFWTINSATDGDAIEIYSLYSSYGQVYGAVKSSNGDLRPVLYLSADVKITGGKGTKANPYKIQ